MLGRDRLATGREMAAMEPNWRRPDPSAPQRPTDRRSVHALRVTASLASPGKEDMATASASIPADRTTSGARWVQLAVGIVGMVAIANLQYGWTLFVNPIDSKFHWGKAAIQIAFTVFVLAAALDLRVVNGFDVRRRAAAAVASAWPRRGPCADQGGASDEDAHSIRPHEAALRATRRGGAGSARARVGWVIFTWRIGWRLDGIRAGLLAGLGGATLVGYACAEAARVVPEVIEQTTPLGASLVATRSVSELAPLPGQRGAVTSRRHRLYLGRQYNRSTLPCR